MKKILWLDVDDVLLDFCGDFNEWLAERIGDELGPKLPPGFSRNYVPKKWNYECLPIGKDEVWKHMKVYIDQHSGNLNVLPGAVEMLNAARGMGWEVNLITAHPGYLMEERIKNLKKHGLIFDHFYSCNHFNTNGTSMKIKKVDLINSLTEKNRVEIFVDDRHDTVRDYLKNSTALVKAGVSPWYPYNNDSYLTSMDEDSEELKRGFTVTSWNENKWKTVIDMHGQVISLMERYDGKYKRAKLIDRILRFPLFG